MRRIRCGWWATWLCALPHKYSDVKANNNFIEKKLKLAATTRNFNTISKLVALGNEG